MVPSTLIPALHIAQAEFSAQTDADGRVVWQHAPERELRFDFSASGYMRVDDVIIPPDGEEHLVTLPPALVVFGTVTDATTGQPIPRFRMRCGWPEKRFPDGTSPRFSKIERFWLSFEGGKFRHSIEEAIVNGIPNPGYMFKFEAEDFTSLVSRVCARVKRLVRRL